MIPPPYNLITDHITLSSNIDYYAYQDKIYIDKDTNLKLYHHSKKNLFRFLL